MQSGLCEKPQEKGKTLCQSQAGRVEVQEVLYGRLEFLFKQVTPYAGEGRVPVFACEETNDNSGETQDFTRLTVAGQSA